MFGDDTESVLQAAAALVNTEPEASHSGADELTRVEDVAAFYAGWSYSGALARSERELVAVMFAVRELYDQTPGPGAGSRL